MNSNIDESIDRIAGRARGRYQSFIHGARSQTEQAAGRVRDGKKPVRTLSRLGVELTSISHRATSDIVKSQARMIENQMDALAGRLHNAAQADSLRNLVADQIRLIPANAAQFVEDTRSTFTVVKQAGGEVKQLIAGTVTELRQPKAKAAAKKAAKKPAARKVAKKPASRKATKKPAVAKKLSEKAAKKKVARKAAAPKATAPKATAPKAAAPKAAAPKAKKPSPAIKAAAGLSEPNGNKS